MSAGRLRSSLWVQVDKNSHDKAFVRVIRAQSEELLCVALFVETFFVLLVDVEVIRVVCFFVEALVADSFGFSDALNLVLLLPGGPLCLRSSSAIVFNLVPIGFLPDCSSVCEAPSSVVPPSVLGVSLRSRCRRRFRVVG